MELIAVMAVLAILSAALAPSVFDLIDDAYAKQEQSNLESLAQDLQTLLETTYTLPSSNRALWSTALAVVSDRPVAQILRNRRNFQRTLYFDPQFLTTSDANFNGYTQTTGLVTAPPSPRLMLISNLDADAPQPAMNSATFNAIWEQSAGAAVIESNDIKIVRLNLSENFTRLTLVNSAGSQTGYSLEGGTRAAVSANNGTTDGIVTRFVINGTQVELYGTPYPVGALSTAALISGAQGFRYATDGSQWFWERT